jgi:uridylate kinase
MKNKYKRILLKLSGESLAGVNKTGLDVNVVNRFAKQVAEITNIGVQVGIVIGGGNIFRGLSEKASSMDRVAADHMGMLATVINAVAFQDALEAQGLETRVMTAISMPQIAEPYIRRKAIRHLDKGRVVLFAGGTGNPYFTTDTAAALRAVEISADVLLKGTRVDGIYSADPEKDANATKIDYLKYSDVISENLRVMDHTAITLCKENKLPIFVFNIENEGNLLRAVNGESIGTIVGE